MQGYESIWQDLVNVEFRQGWRDVKGVKTRYMSAGSEDKPLLVLHHGSAGHAEAYSRNLKAHGEHFWTWSIDMLGHGWTDKPGKNLEIAEWTKLAARIGGKALDTEIGRAHV